MATWKSNLHPSEKAEAERLTNLTKPATMTRAALVPPLTAPVGGSPSAPGPARRHRGLCKPATMKGEEILTRTL